MIPFYYLWIALSKRIGLDVLSGNVAIRLLCIAIIFHAIWISVSKGWKSRTNGRYSAFVFVFVSMYVLRVVFETTSYTTERSLVFYISFIFSVILVAHYAASVFRESISDTNFKRCHIALLVSCTVLVMLYLQFVNMDGRINQYTSESLSVLSLGYLGSLIIGFSFVSLLNKPLFNKNTYIVSCAGIILGLVLISLSVSRGPVLALVISAVCFALAKIRTRKAAILFVSVVSLFIGFLLQASGYLSFDSIVRRTSELENIDINNSAFVRLLYWNEAWDGFVSNPIFGGGLELGQGAHPHNLYIEAFFTTGILGGGMFIITACLIGYKSFSLLKGSQYQYISIFCIQSLVQASVSGAVWGAHWYWMSMSFVAFASWSNRKI